MRGLKIMKTFPIIYILRNYFRIFQTPRILSLRSLFNFESLIAAVWRRAFYLRSRSRQRGGGFRAYRRYRRAAKILLKRKEESLFLFSKDACRGFALHLRRVRKDQNKKIRISLRLLKGISTRTP